MLTSSHLTALTAVLALGLVGGAQTAQAQVSEHVSVTVNYSDLNLDTAHGARVMLRRINDAAATICNGPPIDGIERLYFFEPCVKDVTHRAVARLGNATVASLDRSGPGSMDEAFANAR